MSPDAPLHATAVALDGRAVLLRGAPGAGKSDLAARLIVEAGARLVADDRVVVTADVHGRPIARPPDSIAGMLELRGLGLVRVACLAEAPVALLADLTDRPGRLPDPAYATLCGLAVRRIELDPAAAGAVAKLQLALGAGGAAILPPDWRPGP